VIQINAEADTKFTLAGSIDHYEASKCKQLLQECISKNKSEDIEINISGLSSVSSVTLAFLLFGLRLAKESSKSLHYKDMTPALFNMARVSGIENILITK
tara:strand:- start:15 stop:314 length:300 start_codon:yes stop_codon:yes gene_type:complete